MYTTKRYNQCAAMVLILSRQNILHTVSKILFNIVIFQYTPLKDVLPTELHIKPIAPFVFNAVVSSLTRRH
jgi:hypothetical protein